LPDISRNFPPCAAWRCLLGATLADIADGGFSATRHPGRLE
jgi:hypothetical protein